MRCGIHALTLVIAAGLATTAAQAQQSGSPAVVWPDPPGVRQQQPATVWPDPPAARPPTTRQPAMRQPVMRSPAAAPAASAVPAASTPATPAPARRAPARAPAQAAMPPVDAEPDGANVPPKPRPKPAAAAAQAVACSGPFGRNSSHAQLVAAFGAKNVVFTQVDGPGGSRLDASVIFPNDPKRRLEVLWQDEPARSRPATIVITGGSRWGSPGGLRIGTPLADIEKRNGKPFKLNGFEGETGGSVVDWDKGKLDQLPGGCRIGMRFAPDAKAEPEALGKVASKDEFPSSSSEIRAAKPKVTEIIVGY